MQLLEKVRKTEFSWQGVSGLAVVQNGNGKGNLQTG